jgi:ribosomal-protein-alanine N-acetyltransferase
MLFTSRLLLRPFLPGDIATLFALSREDGMRRWIPDQVYRDEDHAARIVGALSADAVHRDPRVRPYVLAVEQRESNALIGHVGLSPARGSIEIGYAIAERLHGHGFATEAVTAMAEWALMELALPEILGIVREGNIASCRVLEKAGFVRSDDDGALLVYRRRLT